MTAAVAGKVSATPAALTLLAEIVADHGPVMFHQSTSAARRSISAARSTKPGNKLT